MKKVLLALALFAPVITNAQNTQEPFRLDASVLCHKTEKIGLLVQESGENDAFLGLDHMYTPGALVGVFLNRTTGSYTVTISDMKSNITCILSAGKNGQFVNKPVK